MYFANQFKRLLVCFGLFFAEEPERLVYYGICVAACYEFIFNGVAQRCICVLFKKVEKFKIQAVFAVEGDFANIFYDKVGRDIRLIKIYMVPGRYGIDYYKIGLFRIERVAAETFK